MSFILIGIGIVALLIGLTCTWVILRDAFGLSLGAGLMVLLIPCFIVFYAFAHFEHPKKGAVVAGLLGGWGLAALLALVTGGGAAQLLGT